jgi:hypothetical protein
MSEDNAPRYKKSASAWRDFRNCSGKQRLLLDTAFGIGIIKGEVTEEEKKLFVLGGGSGFGGKSFTIRTGVYEAAMRLAASGVKNPLQLVACITETDLEERHINMILEQQDVYPSSPSFEGWDASRAGEDIGLLNVAELRRVGKAQVWVLIFHDPRLGKVYFRHAKNLERRRGVQYDMIWVDELTQFEKDHFFAFSYMLRSSKNPPFLSFVGVTNPDGIGNDWVRKLWVPEFQDFSGEKLNRHQFYFIPFLPSDNPTYNKDVENTLLSARDELVKSRFYGIWDIISGTRFRYKENVHSFSWRSFLTFYLGMEAVTRMTDNEVSIQARKLLQNQDMFAHYCSFDPGLSAAAFYIHAVDQHGFIWTWREIYMEGMIIKEQAALITSETMGIKIQGRYADPALWGKEQGTGLARINQFRNHGITFRRGNNDRVSGWAMMDEKLDYKGEPGRDGFRPPLWRMHESCKQLHFFIRNVPSAKHNPDDTDHNFKRDHAGDSCRYFILSHFGKPTKRKGQNEQSEETKYGGALAAI